MKQEPNPEAAETAQTTDSQAVVHARLVRPLIVGARVWLNDGQNKLIVRINALNEAEAEDSAYRWERHGEIAHAAMIPGSHDIAMVDWPNVKHIRDDG